MAFSQFTGDLSELNNFAPPTALRHNPGISNDWSPEEQSVLEKLLIRYGSEPGYIRYNKIAQALEDKTIRDVALRCRWMTQREKGKKRKDDCSSRKFKKMENVTDLSPKSSRVANSSNRPSYAQSTIPTDGGISYKDIDGVAAQLSQQTARAFDLIAANFATLQVQENIRLFCEAQHNILSISNDSENVTGEVMMPPLPALDEKSIKFILHPSFSTGEARNSR